MDIEKEFEKFIEEVDEKLKPKIKFKFKSQYAAPKKKGKKVSGSTADQPFAFGISRKAGDRGYGKAGRAPIMMGDEVEEETEIEEKKSATGYELYHKDFSSAMQHAYAHAKKKGFVIDPKEIDDKVATGPKKPSSGKTNRYSLKAGRKKVEIQVANLDNKRYELNMYIEGVLQELPAICTTSADDRHSKTMKKAYDANGCKEKNKKQRELYHKDLQKVYDKYGKENESKKFKIKGEESMKDLITAARKILMGEDTNKDKEGTQGDADEYQKKRDEILKGYGVKACGLIKDEKEKKQCFQDLDDAHVSDEEEKDQKKEAWLPKQAKKPKETKGIVHTPAEVGLPVKKKVATEDKTYLKGLGAEIQKKIKSFEKKQKDLYKKFPDLKIKTFVYNPETGKPDIEIKEGDEISESFWKVNIADMPVIFIETSSKSEIIKDMRKKLKPDVFKELSIERVTKAEMIKTYRQLVKGEGGEEDEVKESTALQLKMAFDDAKIKVKGVKGGKLVIAKKDKKKVIDVVNKSFKKGSGEKVVKSQIKFEEVEDQIDPNPESTTSKLFSHVKELMKGK